MLVEAKIMLEAPQRKKMKKSIIKEKKVMGKTNFVLDEWPSSGLPVNRIIMR